MPRYYLHVRDGSEVTEDPDGEVFEDPSLAIAEATETARELMAVRLRSGQPLGIGREIIIADESSNVVANVPFRAALPPEET